MTSTFNNFAKNYLSKLYLPRLTWTDVIEIIIIAFLLYNVLVWIKNTKAWALLKGIIVVVVFAIIAYILNLRTILWIAGKTISVGIIALVIIFQPELRRALEQLGRKKIVFGGLFSFGDNKDKGERFSEKTLDALVRASYEMGAVKTGALMVIEQDIMLEEYIRTGIDVDGYVTSQLLINISKELGTRHRAGVGISEVSDCITIIVSEETGAVSVAVGGELIRDIDASSLRNKLEYIRKKTIDVKSFRLWRGRVKQ